MSHHQKDLKTSSVFSHPQTKPFDYSVEKLLQTSSSTNSILSSSDVSSHTVQDMNIVSNSPSLVHPPQELLGKFGSLFPIGLLARHLWWQKSNATSSSSSPINLSHSLPDALCKCCMHVVLKRRTEMRLNGTVITCCDCCTLTATAVEKKNRKFLFTFISFPLDLF